MAARPSSACSMSLPERIAIGRSGDRSRSSSAAAMARTAVERLRISQRAPRAGRVALRKEDALGRGLRPMHQPLGEIFADKAGSGCGERIRIAPSLAPLDQRHRAAPSLTGRSGGFDASWSRCDSLRSSCAPPWAPRFSRNALSRALASSSPCAMAAASASVAKPVAGSLRAMRGSSCITAKLVNGALPAMRCASSRPLASPAPFSTR